MKKENWAKAISLTGLPFSFYLGIFLPTVIIIIIIIIFFSFCAGAQTAWDMLHEEEMFPRITTSCMDLDNILGGGINCKEVTEIG